MEIYFEYVENKPIDYKKFIQWLFWGTPNLKKLQDNHSTVEHVYSVIEIDLGVSRNIAEKLINNSLKLGFISECGWSSGFLSGYWCVGSGYFYPMVEKPSQS